LPLNDGGCNGPGFFTGNKGNCPTSIGHALWQLWQILKAGKPIGNRRSDDQSCFAPIRNGLAGISLSANWNVATKKKVKMTVCYAEP